MRLLPSHAIEYALLTLLLLLLLTGCGTKGPVQSLYAEPPDAPRNLQIQQQGTSFLLSWQIPTQNQDGSPAGDIGGFQIYRADYTPEDGCPTCREPQQRVANINLKNPATVQQIKRRFYWRDRQLAVGSGYAYRVVPLTTGGRPGAAALSHQVCLFPPAAPSQLRATAQPGQVVLTWQAAERLPDGAKQVGYNLYRRALDESASLVPVNAEPLRESSLTDRALEAGRPYVYRVSTLVRIDNQLVESPLSETVQVTMTAE